MTEIVEGSLVPAPQRQKKTWRDYKKPLRETSQAYAVYLDYRNLPQPRSLLALYEYYVNRAANAPEGATPAEKHVPHMNSIRKWCNAFHWYARVQEYDDEQARLRDYERQQRRDMMNEEHYEVARGQFYRVVSFINERLQEGTLGDNAAVSYAKTMLNLQRVAAGAPTERRDDTLRVEGSIQLSDELSIDPRAMSDDELEGLRMLALELKRREELGDAT